MARAHSASSKLQFGCEALGTCPHRLNELRLDEEALILATTFPKAIEKAATNNSTLALVINFEADRYAGVHAYSTVAMPGEWLTATVDQLWRSSVRSSSANLRIRQVVRDDNVFSFWFKDSPNVGDEIRIQQMVPFFLVVMLSWRLRKRHKYPIHAVFLEVALAQDRCIATQHCKII